MTTDINADADALLATLPRRSDGSLDYDAILANDALRDVVLAIAALDDGIAWAAGDGEYRRQQRRDKNRRTSERAKVVLLCLLASIAIAGSMAKVTVALEAKRPAAAKPVCVRVWNYRTHRWRWLCPCPPGWGSIQTCQVYR